MGRVYAVASAKGGVGKTTTVANLGVVLARNGYRTAVVDVDLGMANVAQVLGIDPTETLHDVLAGEAKLESAVYQGPNGLAVVPGSTDLDAFRSARPEDLGSVVEPLRENSDFVLLDVGAGLSHDTVLPLNFADEVILVAMPGQIALEGAEKTGEIAERLGVPVAGLVLVGGSGDEVDPTTLASIPDAPEMAEAIEAGVPLVERDPDAPASRAYRQLTAELTGADIDVDVDAGDDEASSESGGEPDRADDAVEPTGPSERDPADEEAADEDVAEESAGEGDLPDPDDADSVVDEADGVTFESGQRESTTDDDSGVVVDQSAEDEVDDPAPDTESETDEGGAVDVEGSENAEEGEGDPDERPPRTEENVDSTDASEEAGSEEAGPEERSERRAAADSDAEEEDGGGKGFLDRLLR